MDWYPKCASYAFYRQHFYFLIYFGTRRVRSSLTCKTIKIRQHYQTKKFIALQKRNRVKEYVIELSNEKFEKSKNVKKLVELDVVLSICVGCWASNSTNQQVFQKKNFKVKNTLKEFILFWDSYAIFAQGKLADFLEVF